MEHRGLSLMCCVEDCEDLWSEAVRDEAIFEEQDPVAWVHPVVILEVLLACCCYWGSARHQRLVEGPLLLVFLRRLGCFGNGNRYQRQVRCYKLFFRVVFFLSWAPGRRQRSLPFPGSV